MRFQTAGLLCLIGGLVLFWVGCGSIEPTGSASLDKRKVAGEACAHDANCQTMFCDRNVCVDLYRKRKYGGECAPRASLDGIDAGPPDHGCSVGRLCIEGRCRSCTSDEECRSYFGMGECRLMPGIVGPVCWPYPGRRSILHSSFGPFR